MAYQCRDQIDKKILQVKHIHRDINKFKNRIFTHNGIDQETGVHPLIIHVSSFLSSGRSIIQYAYKEAKELSKLPLFESHVKDVPISKVLKDLRDSDIHAYTIGVHSSVSISASMNATPVSPGVYKTAEVAFTVDTIGDISEPREQNSSVNVSYTMSKRVVVTDELILKLKDEGRQDLLDVIDGGKELYDELECDNVADLHKLCDLYVTELEKFVEHGVANGFIT